MLYLYKNNQQVKVVQMSGNLHPDNLKDIDNRVEPMEAASKPIPPADRYVQDPTTDPDIVERQNSMGDYPNWIYIEYKISPRNLWGKAFPDGKEHLIPKPSTISAVIDIHIEGEKTIGKMIELALKPSNAGNVKILSEAYTAMFIGVDKSFVFPMMRQLGNLAQTALAERAFWKHQFIQAASRLDNTQEEPEWFANLKLRAIEASTIAGTWCRVHSEMWSLLEYKNSPTYGNVPNEIKMRLHNQAKYLEDQFSPQAAARPKLADNHELAMMI